MDVSLILAARIALALSCDAITTDAVDVAQLTISKAERVAPNRQGQTEADNYPEHCLVSGKLQQRTGSDGKPYAIGFELRLPTQWNGRFFFQGGGGSDGMVMTALGRMSGAFKASNGLLQGFAVVSMDAGHNTEIAPLFIGMGMFGLEPRARVDYGYQALRTMTLGAKQIIERAYGAPIQRSYFVGCSNGGRQAMVAATRFPELFDGIIGGNPGFQLPKAAVQHAWDYQQLRSLDSDSPANAFSVEEMALLGDRINARCDALDGAEDGMVNEACKFSLDDLPTCTGARTGQCMSAAQKQVIQNIVSGPVDSQGNALYSDWAWDPGIGSEDVMGWRGWKLGLPDVGGLSLITTGGAASLAMIFTTPPNDLSKDPNALFDPFGVLRAYLANFDFDVDAPKIFATSGAYSESAMSFMAPGDDLRGFADAGGKLLLYHGTADPVFSSNDTVRWFRELREPSSFAKLYLVPGMTHCGGGPSADNFDLLSVLVDWVERDIEPGAVITRLDPDNKSVPASWSLTRTRPLCAYPERALLKPGATDLESAASFRCQ